ncbi:hypothetical protein TNCV_4263751 [Trichonephila clavipes]|nr:hypothetical protein TNCV_4263751 [Trichonephila clavipes]
MFINQSQSNEVEYRRGFEPHDFHPKFEGEHPERVVRGIPPPFTTELGARRLLRVPLCRIKLGSMSSLRFQPTPQLYRRGG